MILFIWLFSGSWILISSSAKLTTYTLMLNFVTCSFRVKQMRSRGVIIRTMRQSGSKRRGRKKNHVDANNIKDTFRIVLLQMRVVLIFGGQVKVGVSLVFLEPFGC